MTLKESQDRLLEQWKNCYKVIANVEQCTNDYMMYYRFRNSKNKIPKPSPKTYKKIRKLKWWK